jgi:hypothetical protein
MHVNSFRKFISQVSVNGCAPWLCTIKWRRKSDQSGRNWRPPRSAPQTQWRCCRVRFYSEKCAADAMALLSGEVLLPPRSAPQTQWRCCQCRVSFYLTPNYCTDDDDDDDDDGQNLKMRQWKGEETNKRERNTARAKRQKTKQNKTKQNKTKQKNRETS